MSHPLQDCTMLIAHPDDEVIFGWPALPYAKRIVCASNDKHNPERQWCSRRGEALAEVGKMLGIEVVCFDHDSEFYRRPHRDGQLRKLASKLIEACGSDTVFTHNQWGEYGHLDHILVHQIAQCCQEVWCSNIMPCEMSWFPVSHSFCDVTWSETMVLDQSLLKSVREVYDRYGCWTWSFDVSHECRIRRC